MSALEKVQDALQSHGSQNRGTDWICPAHRDRNPSLSVNQGADGVVMRCQAGCSVESVVSALGLEMKDLFDKALVSVDKMREVARYKYVDEQGVHLFDVIRYEPKTFRQQTASGQWKLGDTRRVLYRLPAVVAAIRDERRIYLCEGEKDVLAVEGVGAVGTCNPMGAGKWRAEYSQLLAGAHVTIISDNDEVGRDHAHAVADSLEGIAASVEIRFPATGKDAFDHLAAGLTLDDLLTAPVETDESEDVGDEEAPAPGDRFFSKILNSDQLDDISPPIYLVDKFIVADAINLIYGKPGVGKSFVAIDWALSIATGISWLGQSTMQGEVLYLVAEGLSGVGKRKRAWQKEHKVDKVSGVHWYPEVVNFLDNLEVAEMVAAIDRIQPVLVVVDTVAQSISTGDENAGQTMGQLVSVMQDIRRITRAAVLGVHHTPKDGSTPRGHSSLLGAIQTGVLVENIEGEISVKVEKQKDDEPTSKSVRMRKVDDSVVLYESFTAGGEVPVQGEIELLTLLRDTAGSTGVSNSALQEMAGMSRATYFRAKTKLENKGLMVNVGTTKQPRWKPS